RRARRTAERATPIPSSSSSARRRPAMPWPARGACRTPRGPGRSVRARPTSAARGERGRQSKRESRSSTEDAPAAARLRGDPDGGDALVARRLCDYLIWRVKPQIGQVATSVAGSTTRKLVQPLVLQEGWVAVWLRRRIRRIATDRPATEAVVVRVIMCLVLCFPSGSRVPPRAIPAVVAATRP